VKASLREAKMIETCQQIVYKLHKSNKCDFTYCTLPWHHSTDFCSLVHRSNQRLVQLDSSPFLSQRPKIFLTIPIRTKGESTTKIKGGESPVGSSLARLHTFDFLGLGIIGWGSLLCRLVWPFMGDTSVN